MIKFAEIQCGREDGAKETNDDEKALWEKKLVNEAESFLCCQNSISQQFDGGWWSNAAVCRPMRSRGWMENETTGYDKTWQLRHSWETRGVMGNFRPDTEDNNWLYNDAQRTDRQNDQTKSSVEKQKPSQHSTELYKSQPCYGIDLIKLQFDWRQKNELDGSRQHE